MLTSYLFLSYERFPVAIILLPNTSLGLLTSQVERTEVWPLGRKQGGFGSICVFGEEISLLGSREAQEGMLSKLALEEQHGLDLEGWGSGVRPEEESGLVAAKHMKLPFRPGEKQEEGAASESTASY